MEKIDIAREKLLAAALQLVGNRLLNDVSEPGPYDDASAELHQDMLDDAARNYIDELERS